MGIITLLTDFGLADSYVGEVKGVLLSRAPGVVLVDLTHDIAPGDVLSACYVLGRAWRCFPGGTVHLAVVDPGVGTSRPALAVQAGGHVFVGPDNGLLAVALGAGPVEVVELDIPDGASPTFHGRDLFAPAAAALALGSALTEVGTPRQRPPKALAGPEPRHQGKTVLGEVVYVDRFGNLVTNLTPRVVPSYAILETDSVEIGPVQSTFADVPSGGLLAYVGSGGEIEIGVRDGSAARRLGLGVGGRIKARLGR